MTEQVEETVAAEAATLTREIVQQKVNLCTAEIAAILEKYECALLPERIEYPVGQHVAVRYEVRVVYAKPAEG